MKILITNDDGIHSPGLGILAAALAEAGHDPLVAAPSDDMSGSSASIWALNPDLRVEISPADLPGWPDITAWSVAATPALIVLAAIHHAFGEPPALIVAGINAGLNTGHSILHSGTVGAALTAQRLGTSTLAVSLEPGDPWQWDAAAVVAVDQLSWLVDAPSGTTLNLNVPNRPIGEIAVRWATLNPSGTVRAALAERGGALQLEMHTIGPETVASSDATLVHAGYAALTSIEGVAECGPPPGGTARPRPSVERSLEALPTPHEARLGAAQQAMPQIDPGTLPEPNRM